MLVQTEMSEAKSKPAQGRQARMVTQAASKLQCSQSTKRFLGTHCSPLLTCGAPHCQRLRRLQPTQLLSSPLVVQTRQSTLLMDSLMVARPGSEQYTQVALQRSILNWSTALWICSSRGCTVQLSSKKRGV